MIALLKQVESVSRCLWWALFPVKSNLEPSFSNAYRSNLAIHKNVWLLGKRGGDVQSIVIWAE